VNVGCLNNERAPWRKSCQNVTIRILILETPLTNGFISHRAAITLIVLITKQRAIGLGEINPYFT
jgi:hypothetical protein